jgi:hypothetical protein
MILVKKFLKSLAKAVKIMRINFDRKNLRMMHFKKIKNDT